MNIELIKLTEFHEYGDNDGDKQPSRTLSIHTDETRSVFVVSWRDSMGILKLRYVGCYQDAIGYCLDATGWGELHSPLMMGREF